MENEETQKECGKRVLKTTKAETGRLGRLAPKLEKLFNTPERRRGDSKKSAL